MNSHLTSAESWGNDAILHRVGSSGEQPLEVTGKVRCKSGTVPQLWRRSVSPSQNARRFSPTKPHTSARYRWTYSILLTTPRKLGRQALTAQHFSSTPWPCLPVRQTPKSRWVWILIPSKSWPLGQFSFYPMARANHDDRGLTIRLPDRWLRSGISPDCEKSDRPVKISGTWCQRD